MENQKFKERVEERMRKMEKIREKKKDIDVGVEKKYKRKGNQKKESKE